MVTELTTTQSPVDDGSYAAVRRLFERVYSKGELNLVGELVTTDAIGHSAESTAVYAGPAGVRSHVIGLRTAFGGFSIEIDRFRGEGDGYEVAWTAVGTHERPYLGVSPTCTIDEAGEEPHGTPIAVEGVATVTIQDGKIHEWSMDMDLSELSHQLGVSLDRPTAESEMNESAALDPVNLERKV